jgi:hypothetical protein
MARDGGLTKLFMKHLGAEGHLQAIETGGTGRGIFDLNYVINGNEGWVEMKTTGTNSVGIWPEQIAWAERRGRAGGRVFLAVRKKHEGGVRLGAPIDHLILFNAKNSMRVISEQGMNMATPLYVSPANGPKSWDWSEVRKILCGH